MTKPKLLLADDSVTIRKVVELTFADEGVEVFAVGDGNAAMQKFVEVQPDIVLVDVEMPGPNGYQICEMIKQDEATQHIPVLLLVGSFEPFDQDLAERAGADGFLTKPFQSIRDLVARVTDLLGNGSPPQDAGPEIEDIEELYTSSFADTLPIQDYDTEEDPFTNQYPEQGMPKPAVHDAVAESDSGRGQVESVLLADVADQSREDGFRDAAFDDELIETLSQRPVVGPNHFQTLPLDDEMIEAFHPAGAVLAENDAEFTKVVDDPVTVKEFDWSPAARVADEPSPEPAAANFEPRFVFAEAESINETHIPGHENHPEGIVGEAVNEPSEQLISLLTKRIVERLSDRVIREIAQDAVPRIAEKLIREALQEDKNSSQ